jgi:hypothetical protein
VVVREVVAPPAKLLEVWHGRPGSDVLVREAPKPASVFDGIDRSVEPSLLGVAMGALTQDDVDRIIKSAYEVRPPPVEFVHPKEYRRRAISAIWSAWGGWAR